MCHLSVELDLSVNPVAPILGVVEESGFYLRSVRLVPTSRSPTADVYLSLGGGSKYDFDELITNVRQLPGVCSTLNTIPPL